MTFPALGNAGGCVRSESRGVIPPENGAALVVSVPFLRGVSEMSERATTRWRRWCLQWGWIGRVKVDAEPSGMRQKRNRLRQIVKSDTFYLKVIVVLLAAAVAYFTACSVYETQVNVDAHGLPIDHSCPVCKYKETYRIHVNERQMRFHCRGCGHAVLYSIN